MNVLQLKDEVIEPTLRHLDLKSVSAVYLLLGTMAQASQLGTTVKTTNDALSPYGIPLEDAVYIITSYLPAHPALLKRFNHLITGTDHDCIRWDEYTPESIREQLICNFEFSTAVARLIYHRAETKLPNVDNIPGLARYWYKHFPTQMGKTSEWVRNYNRYVLGEI